jgi:uncharacterized protein (DUF2237 family)
LFVEGIVHLFGHLLGAIDEFDSIVMLILACVVSFKGDFLEQVKCVGFVVALDRPNACITHDVSFGDRWCVVVGKFPFPLSWKS